MFGQRKGAVFLLLVFFLVFFIQICPCCRLVAILQKRITFKPGLIRDDQGSKALTALTSPIIDTLGPTLDQITIPAFSLWVCLV